MGCCVLVTCMHVTRMYACIFSQPQHSKRCLLDPGQSTICFCLASLCYILSSSADKVDLQLNCFQFISFGCVRVSVLQDLVSSL